MTDSRAAHPEVSPHAAAELATGSTKHSAPGSSIADAGVPPKCGKHNVAHRGQSVSRLRATDKGTVFDRASAAFARWWPKSGISLRHDGDLAIRWAYIAGYRAGRKSKT